MTRERALEAGFTDYTGVSLEDMIDHLTDWKKNTDKTCQLLQEHLVAVRVNAVRLDDPENIEAFINYFLDLFQRYSADFARLVAELPISVEMRHVETIQQIFDSSRRAETWCITFKREYIQCALKDETLRVSLVDRIYGDTRDMIVDYLDLSNLVHRMKAFVGTTDAHIKKLTANDIDALELKPNIFGIGINLNHIFKRLKYIFTKNAQ